MYDKMKNTKNYSYSKSIVYLLQVISFSNCLFRH